MGQVRLIYVSRMTEVCDTDALEGILEISRRNNKASNITGFLCYDPAFFLQCLEGPRAAVNRLYSHIICDDRHTNVTLLEYADIDDRIFGEWSMAFVRADSLDPKIVDKYASRGSFNPITLTAEQSQNLFQDLAGTLKDVETA